MGAGGWMGGGHGSLSVQSALVSKVIARRWEGLDVHAHDRHGGKAGENNDEFLKRNLHKWKFLRL